MQHKLLIIAALLLGGIHSKAQFTGGSGDGFDHLMLNEGSLNVDFIFKGGSGDGFDAISTGSVLPLQLVSLTVKYDKATDKVHLTWKTVNEINTQRFNVEWCRDAASYGFAGSVNAAGNVSNQYSFLHAPPEGKNYYRLKMLDKDGSYKFSAVVLMQITKSGKAVISVYPNPTVNILSIKINKDNVVKIIKLIDVNGRVVQSQVPVSQNVSMNVSHLPRGMYTLQYSTANGLQSIKIVLQ